MQPKPAKRRGGVRALAPIVRAADAAIGALLGYDEVAARVRRYVADHEAPGDDRAAFERLCVVIFAQGIGFPLVAAKIDALRSAFSSFAPSEVAGFEEARVDALVHTAGLIRNRAKIEACVENARRWVQASPEGGSYLGRIASVAAVDDAAAGWPQLVALVRGDFARIAETAARLILKRWGFFTACAHPGVRRLTQRLEVLAPNAEHADVQRLVGAAAQRIGRDPYSVEAGLALFAGVGPCRPKPDCSRCALAERCPSAFS